MSKKIESWNTKLRYKAYEDWPNDYIQFLKESVNNADWRLNYHIQPVTGLLNDPNGFSYFNNEWHLFYQAYPMGPLHGLKSWYHLTSKNLIDWKNKGVGLLPDTPYDSHGVYSGSALPVDEDLFLMYTGNVRDKDWNRYSYQLGAWLKPNGSIKKIETPLIDSPPKGYTHHFRDPQVFKMDETYIMLIGAQTEEKVGDLLVYQSNDLSDWNLLGPLNYAKNKMGYMVECPNLVFIDSKPVLLFCPQGVDKSVVPYDNIYPNMYVTGDSFNLDHLEITHASKSQNLDEGFDIYASQAFNAPDGRALSIGWIGLPEIDYPTFDEGWAHCLSLVKELTIKNNKLYQYPVEETKNLRITEDAISGSISKTKSLIKNSDSHSYELELIVEKNTQGTLTIYADEENRYGFKIHYNTKSGTIIVDRHNSGVNFAEEYGTTRQFEVTANDALTMTLFVDESVCEIYFNKGEKTMTSRVFPNKKQTNIFIEGDKSNYKGTFYPLRSMKK